MTCGERKKDEGERKKIISRLQWKGHKNEAKVRCVSTRRPSSSSHLELLCHLGSYLVVDKLLSGERHNYGRLDVHLALHRILVRDEVVSQPADKFA